MINRPESEDVQIYELQYAGTTTPSEDIFTFVW